MEDKLFDILGTDWEATGLLDGIDNADEHNQLSDAFDYLVKACKVKENDEGFDFNVVIFALVRRIFTELEDKGNFHIEDVYRYCARNLTQKKFENYKATTEPSTLPSTINGAWVNPKYGDVDWEAEYVAMLSDTYDYQLEFTKPNNDGEECVCNFYPENCLHCTNIIKLIKNGRH